MNFLAFAHNSSVQQAFRKASVKCNVVCQRLSASHQHAIIMDADS
ncbi:hypothetical protein F7D08_1248 [Bifidobacterium cebidarum]|uniref:Uncharacterized protein n=1 Tax=Bifidobacterium cebidarum TaxID=2650773 RepID=A0A6I1GNS8_9BIFI|nr:hypothetical protein F7D08_1248 [Bifidobacterium cebidarum]